MTVAFVWPAAILLSVLTVSLVALAAWRGWLSLKRLELASRSAAQDDPRATGVRIEMADLRERLRKLEAIATGVDL